jgi:hypothetical protein
MPMPAADVLRHFVNDDPAYVGWLAEYPHGFVVNSHESPDTRYLLLHRATCDWINSPGRANWTTNGYMKTCSDDVAALAAWAARSAGGIPRPCRSCNPDPEGRTVPQTDAEILVERSDTSGLIVPAASAYTGPPHPPGKRSLPATIWTGCPELDLAWRTYSSVVLYGAQFRIADTARDLNWHAFLGHITEMHGFRAGEFVGIDRLTCDGPGFVPLATRGIGVPKLAALWAVAEVREHLLQSRQDEPLSGTLDVLRTFGGDLGASLAGALDAFPWPTSPWCVRALLQNSAALRPAKLSFRRWLKAECDQLGVYGFPPSRFQQTVTLDDKRIPLEDALRTRIEKTFWMIGPAISAYMLCDWQLWLWGEGQTEVFASFKLDSFHEAFVAKFGRDVIPADESGFANWWHGLFPELPPRLANACIRLAVEHNLLDSLGVRARRVWYRNASRRVSRPWASAPSSAQLHGASGSEVGRSERAASKEEDVTRLAYPKEIDSIDIVRQAIRTERPRLEAGLPIPIQLRPRGYRGVATVIIDPGDPGGFHVTGVIAAPYFFPKRIRLAAWGLFQEQVFGRFLIDHDRRAGILIIRRVDVLVEGDRALEQSQ